MDNDFIGRLREARLRSKIKQYQIADHFQISEQAVGKWFKTGNVAKEKLPFLADLLNVPLNWLMTGDTSDSSELHPVQKELLGLFSKLSYQEKEDIIKIIREKAELHSIREELATYKSVGTTNAHA